MPRLFVLLSTLLPFSFFCHAQISDTKKSHLAAKILLDENGVFRGHQWGESKKQVRAKEKLSLQAENDSLLAYVMSSEDSTLIDVQYIFDSLGTTKKFVLAFVANEENKEKILQDDFIAYYSQKFSSPILLGDENKRWNSKKGYLIDLRNIKDESGSGTEIIYYRP